MFFSTDTERLPRVGDLVTKYDFRLPWLVTRRQRNGKTGQVFLSLQHGDVVKERVKVELLEHWPQKGDKVAVALGPFVRWAKAINSDRFLRYADDHASPVSKVLRVLSVDGDMAATKNASGQGKWASYKISVPVSTLRVLEKADGRKAI